MFKQGITLLVTICFCALLGFTPSRTEGTEQNSFLTAAESGVPSKPGPSKTAPMGPSSGTEISPGRINARSALLLEVSTGTTIFEQNADQTIEPASFTKVLTLFLINEALKKETLRHQDEIYISEEAWKTGGSKMFLKVGTKIPLSEIIKGIAVVSGNDACVAAAEHLAGNVPAFVERMNQKSRELGMTGSRFLNPHGLPAPGQITTARDMARMNMAYLRQFPESLQFHSLREYAHNDITQQNRNGLLSKDSSVDGLKTGHIASSGYHLSATAERNGMRLLAVVMGASSPAAREQEAMKLLNFGFQFYTLVKPFPGGQPITAVRIWKGKSDRADLYPFEPTDFLVAKADKDSVKWEVRTGAKVTAPVAAGTRLGEVVFSVSDKSKKVVPLINRTGIEEAGWLKRGWQTIVHAVLVYWKISAIAAGLALVFVMLAIAASRRKRTRRSRISLMR